MDGKAISGTEVDDLIMSFLSGNSSLPDEENLLDWVNQSEDNKAYFLKRQKIWLGMGQDCNTELVNTEKALEKVILATGLDLKAFAFENASVRFRHCQKISVNSADSLNAFRIYLNLINIIAQDVIEKNSSSSRTNLTTGPASLNM